MNTAMEQLVYASTAAPTVAGGDVFNIIEQSSRRNPQRGVTGFLVFVNGIFLQYVEGPVSSLDMLLNDLGRDSRHHSIRVIDRRPCEARAFPKWSMKRVTVIDNDVAVGSLLAQLRDFGLPQPVMQSVEQFLTVDMC